MIMFVRSFFSAHAGCPWHFIHGNMQTTQLYMLKLRCLQSYRKQQNQHKLPWKLTKENKFLSEGWLSIEQSQFNSKNTKAALCMQLSLTTSLRTGLFLRPLATSKPELNYLRVFTICTKIYQEFLSECQGTFVYSIVRRDLYSFDVCQRGGHKSGFAIQFCNNQSILQQLTDAEQLSISKYE